MDGYPFVAAAGAAASPNMISSEDAAGDAGELRVEAPHTGYDLLVLESPPIREWTHRRVRLVA